MRFYIESIFVPHLCASFLAQELKTMNYAAALVAIGFTFARFFWEATQRSR
jgi:hypothetical protein